MPPTAGSGGMASSTRSRSGDGRAVTLATFVVRKKRASVGMREMVDEKRMVM